MATIDQRDVSVSTDVVASRGDGDDRCRASGHPAQRGRLCVFVLSTIAFLSFVLPELAGFSSTAHRIESRDTWWIDRGAAGDLLVRGLVVLFRVVFVRDPSPIGWSGEGRRRWLDRRPRACSPQPAPAV